jgi:hypothetical protein
MPVSHSHQLLCVPVRLSTTVVSLVGFDGSVTSQISWALPPSGRSKYHLPFTPFGRVLPLHTRTIWARPVRRSSPVAICARYLVFAGSVTSTIDVPLTSTLPVSGFMSGFWLL